MESFQCAECEHHYGALTCYAFPDGIPEPILTGQFDHAEPFEGDHGIRFEPIRETR